MGINMKEWIRQLPETGKAMPLLSFPSAQLLGATVYQFTHRAELQTEGIVRTAQRTDAAAAVCMMDLSVEAEAFGCAIKAEENEVPTVTGILISDEDEAEALDIPAVGSARTGMYIEAARMAKKRISDRPVFAGIIGPFSLAGRLMDVSEALVNCIADEDFVLAALKKTTPFLISYAQAYKDAGLDGIENGLVLPKNESGNLFSADESVLKGLEKLPTDFSSACKIAVDSDFIKAHIPQAILNLYRNR